MKLTFFKIINAICQNISRMLFLCFISQMQAYFCCSEASCSRVATFVLHAPFVHGNIVTLSCSPLRWTTYQGADTFRSMEIVVTIEWSM